MPRYKVVTKRALYNGIVIEADDEDAAKHCVGDILDEAETDTWADALHSVEQVADDCEEVGDLP